MIQNRACIVKRVREEEQSYITNKVSDQDETNILQNADGTIRVNDSDRVIARVGYIHESVRIDRNAARCVKGGRRAHCVAMTARRAADKSVDRHCQMRVWGVGD